MTATRGISDLNGMNSMSDRDSEQSNGIRIIHDDIVAADCASVSEQVSGEYRDGAGHVFCH